MPDRDAASAPLVEQVMDALAATDGDNGYQVTKGYLDESTVEWVLSALRSLPVAQRMEAMGMEQIGWFGKQRLNRVYELGPKAGHAPVFVEKSDV